MRSKSRLIRLITGSGELESFGTDSLESHNVLVAVEAVDDVLQGLLTPGVAAVVEDESRLTRLPTERGSCPSTRLSPLVLITRAGIAYTCSVEPATAALAADAPAGVDADDDDAVVDTHGGKTGSGTCKHI